MNMYKIAAVILGGTAIFGIAPAQRAIAVRGSDTMLIMNQRLVEAYGKSGGGSVNVSGGGSSIGINGFINGVCEICASSRPMVHRAGAHGAMEVG